MSIPRRCPTHKTRLVCPKCMSARGGAASSPAKTRAAQRNSAKGAIVRRLQAAHYQHGRFATLRFPDGTLRAWCEHCGDLEVPTG